MIGCDSNKNTFSGLHNFHLLIAIRFIAATKLNLGYDLLLPHVKQTSPVTKTIIFRYFGGLLRLITQRILSATHLTVFVVVAVVCSQEDNCFRCARPQPESVWRSTERRPSVLASLNDWQSQALIIVFSWLFFLEPFEDQSKHRPLQKKRQQSVLKMITCCSNACWKYSLIWLSVSFNRRITSTGDGYLNPIREIEKPNFGVFICCCLLLMDHLND